MCFYIKRCLLAVCITVIVLTCDLDVKVLNIVVVVRDFKLLILFKVCKCLIALRQGDNGL